MPRSVITPALYRKACDTLAVVSDVPVTWAAALMAKPTLVRPPSVPSSTMAPPLNTKARARE